jgi:hypothetical protein
VPFAWEAEAPYYQLAKPVPKWSGRVDLPERIPNVAPLPDLSILPTFRWRVVDSHPILESSDDGALEEFIGVHAPDVGADLVRCARDGRPFRRRREYVWPDTARRAPST